MGTESKLFNVSNELEKMKEVAQMNVKLKEQVCVIDTIQSRPAACISDRMRKTMAIFRKWGILM